MARRPRLQYPGAIYHVMSRGNRKGPIFDDDEDRCLFLETLRRTVSRYDVRCYALCLMGNHYHLLLETPRGDLSEALRYLNGVYTQTSNRRHKRTGHVFEGRFRSIVIERESYLRRTSRYIVLNPVRSGAVQNPSGWRWSSYCATAGLEPPPPFLHVDWIDWVFGGATRQEAHLLYRLYVNDCLPETPPPESSAMVIGTERFQRAVRTFLKADDPERPLPRAFRTLARPGLSAIFAGAVKSRRERDRLIRHAHTVYGYRLAEIAAFLRLHPSTATLAVRRLEAAEDEQ